MKNVYILIECLMLLYNRIIFNLELINHTINSAALASEQSGTTSLFADTLNANQLQWPPSTADCV